MKWVITLIAFFVFVACDSDTEPDVPPVEVPELISTTPAFGSTNVKTGEVTILLTYNKNVNFATKRLNEIQFTGGELVSANVFGISSTLTIVTKCAQRGATYKLTVPAGIVSDSNANPAAAVSLEFSTADLDGPVIATSAKAVKLYNYLIDNFEEKTISGMMANVAWNTDEAEQVYEWTGKYPAINGFDYIHLPASLAGANWINYGDITPVKNWADNNGIVTASWHWNVPRKEPGETALNPDTDYAFYMSETTFNAANATAYGTWENKVFTKDLAAIVSYLKLLKEADIPVLWRPFHEAAGKWFWWGKDADSFKALWIAMFDYFKKEDLNNLIWVWTSEGNDANWYPGDQYVDIIGRDLYSKGAANCFSEFVTTTGSYGNKMATLSECGSVGLISEQWEAGARWAWFVPWYPGTDENDEPIIHADKDWWIDAMEQTYVVDRASLPELK